MKTSFSGKKMFQSRTGNQKGVSNTNDMASGVLPPAVIVNNNEKMLDAIISKDEKEDEGKDLLRKRGGATLVSAGEEELKSANNTNKKLKKNETTNEEPTDMFMDMVAILPEANLLSLVKKKQTGKKNQKNNKKNNQTTTLKKFLQKKEDAETKKVIEKLATIGNKPIEDADLKTEEEDKKSILKKMVSRKKVEKFTFMILMFIRVVANQIQS